MMRKKLKVIIPLVLVFAIIAGFLSLSIRPAYSGVNYNSASTDTTTDKAIRFNENGKLKILHKNIEKSLTKQHTIVGYGLDRTATLNQVNKTREGQDPPLH